MSTTIGSVLLQFAAILLPMLGIDVGTEQLTTTIQTLVIVLTGVWIWYERVKKGGVNWFGAKI